MADADHLRRLAYLMLAPSLGRRRRFDLASAAAETAVNAADQVAALVREVLRASAGRTGLVLLERGEANRELAALPPAARISYVLEHAEGLSTETVGKVLRRAEVTDPETALALAAKSPLDPAVLERVQIPQHAGPRAAVVAASVVIAIAAGVAVPLVAVGGHDKATDTGVSRPLPPVTAPAPAPPPPADPRTTAQLGSLLGKIDQRLLGDTDAADRKRLEALRDAVAAKLAQLSR
ncbi:MAG TPA: hypothetical protein VHU88_22185 [Sporichthyaceae bacterium]|jgi:hypothetical protein|nr:hypothetical protein [Sporichthyaceae bacterium]